MCGIAGIYSLNGQSHPSRTAIERMIGVLHHRGPDEAGVCLDDQIELGHARLSIIVLCSGTRPIHNKDTTMYIANNEQVYNYGKSRLVIHNS